MFDTEFYYALQIHFRLFRGFKTFHYHDVFATVVTFVERDSRAITSSSAFFKLA